MTDKEKILAEIERLYNEEAERFDTPQEIGAKRILVKLSNFIYSLSAEQQSEDLEKEINDYFKENIEICNDDSLKCGGDVFRAYDLLNAIENFLQWQKEQMMKSAIEVKINRDTLYNLKPIIHEKYQDLKIGDKILIVKEDEQCSTE